jgi:hypothetical protein
MTVNGARVVAPDSPLPSYFNTPSDPWSVIASGWNAGNPSTAGTSGCFICLRLYGKATDVADARQQPYKYYPQPYLQGYVHDSESPGHLAVDDPNWYTNVVAKWQAVDCPVGNTKIYFESLNSQTAGFTKLLCASPARIL